MVAKPWDFEVSESSSKSKVRFPFHDRLHVYLFHNFLTIHTSGCMSQKLRKSSITNLCWRREQCLHLKILVIVFVKEFKLIMILGGGLVPFQKAQVQHQRRMGGAFCNLWGNHFGRCLNYLMPHSFLPLRETLLFCHQPLHTGAPARKQEH